MSALTEERLVGECVSMSPEEATAARRRIERLTGLAMPVSEYEAELYRVVGPSFIGPFG